MFQYDARDRAISDARLAQFRDQTQRFLVGQLSEDEFKPLRLQNGLSIERHAPMLRIAIPYGVVSARQLRALADIARHHDRGYAHFTTRQNIQFNWVKLEEAPDILGQLAAVQMHAIQTSGSCIRNVTTDAFAGAAADERVDPRPYAELLRQWSTLHPEFAFLPRKFKVAFNGAHTDRAATGVHDLAFDLYRGADGEVLARVLVGGGQGRTPRLASVIREDLPWRDLLSYSTAVLRTYNRFGRRDNISRRGSRSWSRRSARTALRARPKPNLPPCAAGLKPSPMKRLLTSPASLPIPHSTPRRSSAPPAPLRSSAGWRAASAPTNTPPMPA
jgi:sulfite reductase (NADPH) hemoprotein beta-component